MAEGILQKMLEEKGIGGVEVQSAGVTATNGEGANPTAVEVAGKHGVDLRHHVSRPVTGELMDWADWVIAMGPDQRDCLKRDYPGKVQSIILLKELGRPDPRPQDLEIDDPLGSDYWGYEHSFLEIEAEIERILPYLNG
jgi:protein-tyrosine-phosphatase